MLAVGNMISGFITRTLRSALYLSPFALLLSAGSAFAQQKVSVRVTDQTGASIRNAQVTLVSARGESTSSFTADADGLVAVPCSLGSQVQVRALGFETRLASVGSCGQEIAIRLAPASVETTINVTVTADAAPNEPTATSSSISRTTARTVMDAVEDLSPAIFVTRRGVMGYGISTNGTGQMSIRGVGGSVEIVATATNSLTAPQVLKPSLRNFAEHLGE